MLEIRLLGQFDLRCDGEPIELPTRAAQSLLAYLVLNAGVSQRREKLAGMLWPDSTEANARGYLRHALWRTRRSLDGTPAASGSYLRVDDIELRFIHGSSYWLDVEALIGNASPSDLSVADLTEAVSHYQGELLPGFYDEWVMLERERLNANYERKMKLLLDRLTEERRWDEIVEAAEGWIAHGRVPEAAYQAMMVAHAGLRDPAGVKSVFRRLVETLDRELGLEPSKHLQDMYGELTEGLTVTVPGAAEPEREQALAEAPPTPGEPPYMGLAYFDVEDARRFYGRQRLIRRLVERLREHPFLGVVIGASGSGKSSLVRAGLIPALQAGGTAADGPDPPEGSSGWRYHVLTPSAHPVEALATSLTRSARSVVEAAGLMDDMLRDRRSLRLFLRRQASESDSARAFILIDQFEELFTLCQNQAERVAFVENLLAAARPNAEAIVVIALRADFYSHCADFPGLRDALAKHQEYIGGMNARELRQAIEGPAEAGNWEFQDGLVDLILRDVQGEPGRLPLLSHALLETWRRRNGRTMTLTGYARAGGVQRAIARTADSVYNQLLDPPQQVIARRTFTRLTGIGERIQDARRRAEISELVTTSGADGAVAEVLNVLADARLVTLHEDSVEMAHEALIREWPLLRRWLEEDRESLRLHRHLTDSALEWDRRERDPDELYRGARLEAARAWAEQNRHHMNPLELEYLEHSIVREQQENAQTEHSNQRLRRLARGLVIVLALAVAAAGAALSQSGQARSAARIAGARALIAAALASMDEDPERSMLLALHAIDDPAGADQSILVQAEAVLREALAAVRVRASYPGSRLVALSADGAVLVTSPKEQQLTVIEVTTGELIRQLSPHGDDWVTSIAFNSAGDRMATGSFAGEIKLWDTTSWEQLWAIDAHEFVVRDLSFSQNGSRLASASNDQTSKIWETESGVLMLTLASHRASVSSIRFAPDSSVLATTDEAGLAHIWEAASSSTLFTLEGHSLAVTGLAISPDSQYIATISDDDLIRLWDTDSGAPQLTIAQAHAGGVNSVIYAPDGSSLITGGSDARIRIWDPVSGRELLTLGGHSDEVQDLAISSDGLLLASTSKDGTSRLWDLSGPHSGEWLRREATANSVDFRPDGMLLASGGTDGVVAIWDARLGQRLRTLADRDSPVTDVAFDPSGSRLAAAGAGGAIHIWDPEAGELRLTIETNNLEFIDLAFTADGEYLNALGIPHAFIFSSRDGQIHQTFSYGGNTDGEYSPDGMLYAWTDTYGHIGTVLVSDPEAPEILPNLANLTNGVNGAEFSPDGQQLLTTGTDGLITLWNTDPTLISPEYSQADRELMRLEGHSGSVQDAAYSPDGGRIVSIGHDQMVRMWDAITGEQLFAIPANAQDVAFSTSGRYFVTANQDGSISWFLADLQDLIDEVRSRLTRGLTDSECRQYLQSEACPPLH